MLLDRNPNYLTRNPLDRASERRSDSEWLRARLEDPGTLIIPLWRLMPFVIETRGGEALEPGWLRPGLLEGLSGPEAATVFLGMEGETAHFAADISSMPDPENEGPLKGLGRFEDLRGIALRLNATDAAILAQAKSMIDWHARHRFCAACGAESELVEAGYKRLCPACNSEHFPRVDPVAIVLAVRDGTCLLGRGPKWPEGFFSALAGFVEPGETIEQSARREVFEETGIRIRNVRFHSSQPWPYASSLMIGCLADAENEDIRVDEIEIAEARWFPREDVKAMLKGETVNGYRCPPAMAIAHQLLRHWVYEG
ncbi:MAG: NAD(+) diphosphatase [Alphaproteobacteria bacterium]